MATFYHTLRFKLAMLYLLVFGVIQTGLGLAIYTIRERERWQEFEASLKEKGAMVEDYLDSPPIAAVPRSMLNSASFVDSFVQVTSADGTVLQKSESLGEVTLPWMPPESKSSKPWFQTFETKLASVDQQLSANPVKLRMYGFAHTLPEGTVVRVQVARDTEEIEKMSWGLLRITVIAITAALLVSGIAAGVVARRSLTPIGTIARNAREFAATDWHRRLAVPVGHDEVSEMARVLNQMLDRLERAFRAQERFVADVSHEIKTPFAILLTEAQLLSQRPRDAAEYQRYVDTVREEVQRLTRTVHSLLMLTRAESGLPLEQKVSVSVSQVVTDAVQHCAAQAAQYGVSLLPMLAEADDDPIVNGDAGLLETAVINLVRNAIRFSPSGETVGIEVRLPVELNGSQSGVNSGKSVVQIVVRDNGSGIAPEHLPGIFDRFFQVPGAEGTRAGTGLGLAIARAVVELHGGSIAVTNQPAGGCELVIELPRVDG